MSEPKTVTFEYKVHDCRDCPYRKHWYSHGECWEECSHPDAPGNYQNILWGCQSQFTAVPKWCPLKGDGAEPVYELGNREPQTWDDAAVSRELIEAMYAGLKPKGETG